MNGVRRFRIIAVWLGLLSIAVFGGADGTPSSTRVLEDPDNRFVVTFDGSSGKVEVATKRVKGTAPREMTITIFRDPELQQTIQLKAMDQKDPLPRYEGQLSPSAGSYVGVELSFETSLKMLKVLRSMPYIPKLERKE